MQTCRSWYFMFIRLALVAQVLASWPLEAKAQLGRLFGRDASVEAIAFAPKSTHPAQPVLVRVNYVARVDPQYQAVAGGVYMMTAPTKDPCEDECATHAGALDEAIAKTNYFAWSLFVDLERRLPAGTVIVRPATLNNRYQVATCEAEGHELPAVLDVDIFFYVQPRRDATSGIPLQSTFGPAAWPIVAIRTGSTAGSPTKGYLASTSGYTRSQRDGVAECLLADILNDRRSAAAPAGTVLRSARPADPESHFLFPFQERELDRSDWKRYVDGHGAEARVQSPLPVFRDIADVVIDLLNSVDHAAAVEDARRRYRRLYDPALEGLFLTPEKRAARESMLLEYERLEAKFQREGHAGIHNLIKGEFGRAMRGLIEIEWDHHEKVQSARRSQAVATGIAIIGALLIGRSGGDGSGLSEIFTRTMMDQNSQVVAAGAALEKALGPLAAEQQRMLVEFADGKRAFDVSSIRDLRELLRRDYATRSAR